MLKRVTFIIVLFCFGNVAMAQTTEQEADLKAVFLYNFTKYIDWDDAANNDFIIGVLGNSAIERPITEIAKTNTVNNKNIVVKHFIRPEDISGCNILFIPYGTVYPISSILEKTGKGVLTVSEKPGLGKQGTAFNFVVINDKLKFEANLKAISDAGLKASSQLLKLAIIINNSNN